MKGYGLVCDDGYDSYVRWFETIDETVKEYEGLGRVLTDLNNETQPGTYSLVKKLTKEELNHGINITEETP